MHPSPENLRGLVLGTLNDPEASGVVDHVQHCPQCEETLRGIESTADDFLKALRQPLDKESAALEQEPAVKQFVDQIARLGGPAGQTMTPSSERTNNPAASFAAAPSSLGTLGQYRLLEKIGEGGMGAVYKAVHIRLKKVVAIKVLPADRVRDPQAIARFEREILAIGQLSHPHIVGAHDAGEENGVHYLVMEYVDGIDLAAVCKKHGPLPITKSCEMIRQAALGLQCAHEHGLVHRDIKPSNLIVTREGKLKILDLGLARLSDQTAPAELTSSGQIMGTVDYMSPEQAMSSHSADIRADIYSLGATLYKLLTGAAPFSGPKFESPLAKLSALATSSAPDIREKRADLPPDLAAIIMRMLSRNADARFATPAEVATALAPFARGSVKQPVAVPDAPEARDARPQPRAASASGWGKNGTLVAIAAGMAAVVAVLAIIAMLKTPNGTLQIEADEEAAKSLQIVATQGGEDISIADAQHGWSVKLKEGKYDLKITQGGDRVELDQGTVTVKRNDVTHVTVSLKPLPGAAGNVAGSLASSATGNPKSSDSSSTAVGSLADAPEPFVVLRDGKPHDRFKSFQRALDRYRKGDTIEIQGNGPFDVGLVEVGLEGLRIQAAAGYRPHLQTAQSLPQEDFYHAPPWITFKDAPEVSITGCDLTSHHGPVTNMMSGKVKRLKLDNCRLFGDHDAIFAEGEECLLKDCLLMRYTFHHGHCIYIRGPKLTLENCVIHTSCGGSGSILCASNQITTTITLTHNTLVNTDLGQPLLYQWLEKQGSTEKITVNAEGNIIGCSAVGVPKDQLVWNGKNNLYVGEGLQQGWPDGKRDLFPLEKDSRKVPSVVWKWDLGNSLRQPESDSYAAAMTMLREAGKSRPQSPVGPNWDLVGPGAAYRKSLELENGGKPVAVPEPSTNGPATLIRGGKEVKSLLTVTEALNEALDGDIVEIRSDKPLPSATYPNPAKSPRKVTIRSAPGYHPILSSDFNSPDNTELAFEGIEFHDGMLRTNDAQRIVRIANCSFTQTAAGWARFPLFALLGSKDEKPAQIINCRMPGFMQITVPSGRLEIRNSLLGSMEVLLQPKQTQFALDLDHTALMPTAGPYWGAFSVRNGGAGGSYTVSANHSIIESFGNLFYHQDPIKLSHWSGNNNLFRRADIRWDPNVKDLYSLKDWQTRWKSDADSSTAPRPIDDPQSWALMPESIGYHSDATNHDFGADVSRVARPTAK